MKLDITHLAMETDFQTSNYVIAMEKEDQQSISTERSVCNSFKVISDFTHYGICHHIQNE